MRLWANEGFRKDALILLLVFCLQMLMWWILVEHNVIRALAARAEINAPVLGSDINENTGYFQSYPDVSNLLSSASGQFIKRPLFAPIFILLNWILEHAGFQYPARMYGFLSFLAAACGILMWVLLRKCGWSPLQALLGAFLCTFTFSWMSTFSIPETYSLSVIAAIVCLISGHRFLSESQTSARAWLQHGIIVGTASWLYAPICGASLLVASAVKRPKDWLTVVLPTVMVAFALAITPQMFSTKGGIEKQIAYVDKYGSEENFFSGERWLEVSAVFLIFSFISPVKDFVTSSGFPYWKVVLLHWPVWVALLIIALAYFFVLKRAFEQKLLRDLVGVGCWLVCLLLFFVFFNPREVLLYASLPATIIIYGCATILGHKKGYRIGVSERRQIYAIALAVFAVLLLGINFRPIFG